MLPTQFRVLYRRLDRRIGKIAQVPFLFTSPDPNDLRFYLDEDGELQQGAIPQIDIQLSKLLGNPESVSYTHSLTSLVLREAIAGLSTDLNNFSAQFGLRGVTQFNYLSGDQARLLFLAPEPGSEYNGIEATIGIDIPEGEQTGLTVDFNNQVLADGEDKFNEIIVPPSADEQYKIPIQNLDPLGTYQIQVFADFPSNSEKIFEQVIENLQAWRSQVFGNFVDLILQSEYGLSNSQLFYFYFT